MSRHRAIRKLDYDELLDDTEAEGDLTLLQAEQLDKAVDEITRRLGGNVSIKEVRDTAWYYYFDVDKATNYLLGMSVLQWF